MSMSKNKAQNEKQKSSIEMPKEFSIGESKKAMFWAWLVDGYAVPMGGEKSVDYGDEVSKPVTDKKIVIVSKDELKALIKKAMREGDNLQAQELLEIASELPEISHETVRRSLRVGTGEYFKLLSIKLLENSSFGEVTEKVLSIAIKRFLGELKSRFYGHSATVASRLDHLTKVVYSWEKDRPKPRAMGDEWVPNTESLEPYLEYFPKEDIENDLKEYVLSEIAIMTSWSDELFDKLFVKGWELNVTPDFWMLFDLSASVDENDPDRFRFDLVFHVPAVFDKHDEQILFNTFGEDTVCQFVNRFEVLDGAWGTHDGRAHYRGLKRSTDRSPFVTFRYNFKFPGYQGIIKGPKEFEISSIPYEELSKEEREKIESEVQGYHNAIIRGILSTKEDEETHDIKQISGLVNQWKSNINTSLHEKVEEIMHKLLEKAESPEDFNEIRELNMHLVRSEKFRDIERWGGALVKSTADRASVISFYINPDLWKLLPLVLENTDWLNLADEYLNSKRGADN